MHSGGEFLAVRGDGVPSWTFAEGPEEALVFVENDVPVDAFEYAMWRAECYVGEGPSSDSTGLPPSWATNGSTFPAPRSFLCDATTVLPRLSDVLAGDRSAFCLPGDSSEHCAGVYDLPSAYVNTFNAMTGSEVEFQSALAATCRASPEELIRYAMSMFDVVSKMIFDAVDQIETEAVLTPTVLDRHYRLFEFGVERYNAFIGALFNAAGGDRRLLNMVSAVNTSITPGLTVHNRIELAKTRLLRGASADSVREFLLQGRPQPFQADIADGRGYSVSRSRRELSERLLKALGIKDATLRWEGDELLMTVPFNFCQTDQCPLIVSWPPPYDTEEWLRADPVLAAYLTVLGWSVRVIGRDEKCVTLGLNFGSTLTP